MTVAILRHNECYRILAALSWLARSIRGLRLRRCGEHFSRNTRPARSNRPVIAYPKTDAHCEHRFYLNGVTLQIRDCALVPAALERQITLSASRAEIPLRSICRPIRCTGARSAEPESEPDDS